LETLLFVPERIYFVEALEDLFLGVWLLGDLFGLQLGVQVIDDQVNLVFAYLNFFSRLLLLVN